MGRAAGGGGGAKVKIKSLRIERKLRKKLRQGKDGIGIILQIR